MRVCFMGWGQAQHGHPAPSPPSRGRRPACGIGQREGARETVRGAGDKREGVQGLWAQILYRESREVGPEKAGCFFKS